MGFFFVLQIVASVSFAQTEPPQTFTLDGRLFEAGASGEPLLDSNILMTVQVLNPAKTCILYEEQQTVNTLGSNGFFNVRVGSGTSATKRSAGDSNNSMNSVFYNRTTAITGKTSGGSACTYTPTAADERFFRFFVHPSTVGSTAQLSPDMTLDSVPQAIVAQTLQGLGPSDVFKTSGTSTQAKLDNLLTTNYTALSNLVSGSSSLYLKNAATGTELPVRTSDPVSPVAGQMWFDSSAGKIRFYNGSIIQDVDAGTSGVTSITAGSGLSGGTITGTGTIAISSGGVTNAMLATGIDASKITTGILPAGVVPTGTDTTKLPLAGGTLTGGVTMGAATDFANFNLLSAGHITMSAQKTITVGRYDSTQQGTLITSLTGANAGATWYNSTTNKLMFWNGTSAFEIAETTGAGGDITAINTSTGSGLTGGAASGPVTLAISVDGTTIEIATNALQVKNLGIDSAKLAADAVTSAKIFDGTIVNADINASAAIAWSKIDKTGASAADIGAVPTSRSVLTSAGSALSGGGSLSADRSISVNVDGSTIEVSSNALQVKDGGITNSKISSVNVSKISSGASDYFSYMPAGSECATGEVLKWNATNDRWLCDTDAVGVSAHSALTGLLADDHTQYVLLAGRTGGQNLRGGNAASESLTLESTSHVTKGEVLIQPNGGHVGIGTTSASYPLDVSGNVMAGGYFVRGNDAGLYWGADEAILGHTGSHFITMKTNGNERLRVDSSGNVGIGSISPNAKLDVAGVIRATDICDETGSNCKDISGGWGAGGDIDGITTATGSALSGGTLSGTATLAVVTDGASIQVNGSNELEVKNLGITNAKLAADAVNSAKIQDNTITSSDLANGTIVDADINASAAIAWSKINKSGATAADVGAVAPGRSINTNSGSALTGGGDLTADRNLAVNVDGSTVEISSNAIRVKDGGITDAKINSMNITKLATGPGDYFSYMPAGTECATGEVLKWNASTDRWECGTDSGGVTAHNLLSGLGADDHTQYVLLAGRNGGQILRGGTASGDDITIESTSHATKGDVILQPTSGNVGIGSVSPQSKLDVNGTIRALEICDETGSNCKDISSGWGAGGDIDGVTTNTGSALSGGTASGTATLVVVNDGTTIETNGSNQLQVKDSGITTAKINNLAVTDAKIASVAVDKITSASTKYFTYAPNNVACALGEVLKKTSNGWECGVDSDAGGDITAVTTSGVSGLSGGGTTGAIALTVDSGTSATGVVQNADVPNCGAGQKLSMTSGAPYTWSCVTDTPAVTVHSGLTGLTADDHTQYVLLAGRTGGQSVIGGTAASDNLTLESTSDSTKGYIVLQPNGGGVGIGTTIPSNTLTIANSDSTVYPTSSNAQLGIRNSNTTNGSTSIISLQTVDAGGTVSASSRIVGVHTSHTAAAVSGDMAFETYTANVRSEKMRITSGGNVGIGTSNPSKALHVHGAEAGIFLSETSGGADNEAYLVHYNKNLQFQNRTTAGVTVAVPYNLSMEAPAGTFTVASSGNVGVGTATPATSAQLDVRSTTKGFLPPRMTSGERASIIGPVEGLIVFDTDASSLYVYRSSAWKKITDNNEVSFKVTKTSTQAFSTTPAVINWEAETFDNGSYMDLTTDRFQPAVAGTYFFQASVLVQNMSNQEYVYIYVYKNGVVLSGNFDRAYAATMNVTPNTQTLVYLNGTTDYIDFRVVSGAAQTLDSSSSTTAASGFLVAGGTGGGGGGSDNLGNHVATQNLILGSNWLSGDGNNEGLRIDGTGRVGIGSATPNSLLDVAGVIRATDICDETGANCKDISTGWVGGGDIDGITTATGSALTGGVLTGTATLAVVTDGSTIEVSSNALRIKDGGVTSAKILDGEIVNADINAAAAIAWSKINKTGATAADVGAVATTRAINTNTGSGLTGGGNLTADRNIAMNVDNSTIEIATNTVQVKDGGITNAKINSMNITKLTAGAGDYFAYMPAGTECNTGEVLKWNATNDRWTCGTDFNTGATVHNALTGLGADDHSQYVMLAGRSGGQNIYGGTAASNSLNLESTSNGTKGYVNLQPNGGSVGVGTATPGSTMHIYSSSAAMLLLERNSTLNTAIEHKNSGGSMFAGLATAGVYGIGNNANLNSAALAVTNTNTVGIGTTAPSVQFEVQSDTGPGAIRSTRLTGSASSGNIQLMKGRGTSATPAALQANDGMGAFTFGGYTGATTSDATSAYIKAIAKSVVSTTAIESEMQFVTTDSAGAAGIRMNIDSSGKIGVGTSTAAAPVHIAYDSSTTPGLAIGTSASTTTNYVSLSTGRAMFGYDATGNALALSAGAAKGMEFFVNGSTGTFLSGTQAMTILSGGNVGIGSTNPGSKLDVNGTITATGFSGPVSSSTVSAGNGLVGTPSLTFTSDPDTGFYRNGSDIIGVTNGGANKFNFTTVGLVSPTTGGGAITSGIGLEATPTYAFAGDLDTGWYRPAADTMAASTGGTESMRIYPNGDILFGSKTQYQIDSTIPRIQNHGSTEATSSMALMSWNTAAGSEPHFRLVKSNSATMGAHGALANGHNLGALTFAGSTGSTYKTAAGIYAQATEAWTASVQGTELHLQTILGGGSSIGTRLIIDTNGYTGINTTIPATNLDVNGQMYLRGDRMYFSHDGVTNTNNDFIDFDDTNSQIAGGSTGFISFRGDQNRDTTTWADSNIGIAAGSSYFNGYVGISTTAPSTYLQVGGAVYIGEGGTNGTASVGSDIRMSGAGVVSSDDNFIINFDGDNGTTNSYFSINKDATTSASTELMRLQENGYLGIGTSAPSAKLDVFNGDIAVTGSSTPQILSKPNVDTGYAQSRLYTNTGVSPTTNDYFNMIAYGNNYATTTAAKQMRFNYVVDDNTAFYLLTLDGANGYVGIGTTEPADRLDVFNGDITVRGSNTPQIKSVPNTDAGYAQWRMYTNTGVSPTTNDYFNVIAYGNNYSNATAAKQLRFSYIVDESTAFYLMTLDGATGRVGIGTNDPGTTLDVRATSTILTLGDTDGAGGAANPYVRFYDSVNARTGYVGDGSTGNNDMYLVSDIGNVRVTANGPSGKVDVTGTSHTCTIGNAATVSCSSDERLKQNILPLHSTLEKVLALEPVQYEWKKSAERKNLGFIAQKTQKIFPEVVVKGSDGYFQMDYASLTAPIVAALKEFYAKWFADSQEIHRELASLKETNKKQEQEIDMLKAHLCSKDPKAEFCKTPKK